MKWEFREHKTGANEQKFRAKEQEIGVAIIVLKC